LCWVPEAVVTAISVPMASLALRVPTAETRSQWFLPGVTFRQTSVRLGRHDEAIEQYRKALAVESDNPAIRFNLALALFKTERFSQAADEARVVQRQPENKNAVLLLAECLPQVGHGARVVELLAPWAETWKDEPLRGDRGQLQDPPIKEISTGGPRSAGGTPSPPRAPSS